MSARVFWALVLGFLAGVFLRSLFPVGVNVALFAALLALASLLLGFFERRSRAALVVCAVAFIAVSGGILRMHAGVVHGDPRLNARLGSDVLIEGVVSGEPDVRENSTLVHIAARSLIASTSTPVSAGVMAIFPAHTLISYGDSVRVSGALELPEAFDTGMGRRFDYPGYLAAQGVQYQMHFAQLSVQGHGGNPIAAAVFSLKEAYLRGIRAVLPEPQAGLAAGITVGDKRSVGQELSEAFQRDSLIHMLVLSGYNITVVLNAVAWFLSGFARTAQFGGSIAVVLFFIAVSGGASSAVRAGAMALIAVFARSTHRTYLGARALFAVAFLMVLWDPLTLVFDPSFQLSALATLGLVLYTPQFARLFSRVPEKFGLREILSSTCATQLMVLPLLLYQNGLLSLVSLPANLLALLPVPFAMLFSFIAAVAGALLGGWGAVLALPAYLLLSYIIAVARFFASLPFAAVSIPAFSAWWLLVAYAPLFAWRARQGGTITEL